MTDDVQKPRWSIGLFDDRAFIILNLVGSAFIVWTHFKVGSLGMTSVMPNEYAHIGYNLMFVIVRAAQWLLKKRTGQ